jgi:hypothetical protein
MSSLWGRKHSVSEGPSNQDGEHHDAPERTEDPTERTRLLPGDNRGYLSPDDPAVSPTCEYRSNILTTETGIALQSMECPRSARCLPLSTGT